MSSLPPEDFELLEKACAAYRAKNAENIRSFLDFRKSIPELFRTFPPTEAEYVPWEHPMDNGERYCMKIVYESARVGDPHEVVPKGRKNAGSRRRLTPELCETLNKSYVAPLYADIKVIFEDYDHVTKKTLYTGASQKNVYLCHIPIIVEENSRDSGGYFYINGNKKVTPLTRVADPYGTACYLSPDEGSVYSAFRSGTVSGKTMSTRFKCTANGDNQGVPEVLMKFKGSHAFSALTPGTIISQFGVNPNEAKEHLKSSELAFFGPNAFEVVATESAEANAKEDAEEDAEEQTLEHLFFETELHLKPMAVVSALRITHYMHAAKLYTSRDSLETQVLNGVREYLTEALLRALSSTSKDMCSLMLAAMKRVFKARFDGRKHNSATISLPTVHWVAEKLEKFNKLQKLHYFCATGNLVSGPSQTHKKGLCHQLEENSPLQKISQMNKIATPLSSESAPVEARQYCLSSVGRLCLAQTPEGKTTGLTNAPTVASSVSRKSLDNVDSVIIGAVKHLFCEPTMVAAATLHGVWLSGRFLGMTSEPKAMVALVRSARRQGQLPRDIGVSLYECFVEIRSHAGRMLRALIPLEQGENRRIPPRLSWEQLLYHNYIEMIDLKEESGAYICDTYAEASPQHTHRELFKSALFGASAATIPNITGQPLPRSAYETSQLNQTIGANAGIMDDSAFPALTRALFYPQRSLVSTSWQRNSNLPPQGVNMVICVMTLDANQEDALVFNKRFFDFGGARSVEKETMTFNASKSEKFVAPEGCLDVDPGTGFVKVNKRVRTGDVLCGVSNLDSGRVKRFKHKRMLPAVVEKIAAFTGNDLERCVKVRTRTVRVPRQGDKFSTFSAQKGVVSAVEYPENLPYCEADGIVPDLFVSPFMIPSRMTASSLQEHMLGFACAEMGMPHYDASAFAHSVKSIVEDLRTKKFRGNKKMMRDGATGMRLGFHEIGIVKSFPLNKFHCKARYRGAGKRDMVTGQPVGGKEGRALKLGTMENAALMEHNASAIIVDAKKRCDPTTLGVCKVCGNTDTQEICTLCGGEQKVIETTVSAVRMMQISKTLGVNIKVET